jgi:glycosyltransferase involved in cell wall biosynthesis
MLNMKILLISDETMCADAGGISQTLYNLFSFSHVDEILCITSKEKFITNPPTKPFSSCYITYQFDIITIPKNRIGKFLSPFINWFNFSFNNLFRQFKSIQKQIIKFDPDVIISCPNGEMGIFMNNKLLNGLPQKKVIPYFMDAWMCDSKLKWIGGNVQKSVSELLSHNESWLMISKSLSTILEERYKITPNALLEVHNPVDISNTSYIEPTVKADEITLAYAGALWPMHFDSLKVIAVSIGQVTVSKKIKFVVYTAKGFWDWRKSELEPLGVTYGGSIPYKDIHGKLQQANALILGSSFLKQYYSVSKGSIQTKVTDYLKAKRLIISCGPDYSANHVFLKKHNCGILIETNNIDAAAAVLNKVLENIEDYQELITNGWKLLNEEFTFPKVHNKLIDFLARSIHNI